MIPFLDKYFGKVEEESAYLALSTPTATSLLCYSESDICYIESLGRSEQELGLSMKLNTVMECVTTSALTICKISLMQRIKRQRFIDAIAS